MKDIQEMVGPDLPKKETKALLKELIEEERLSFTYEFGCTFVVPSLHAPFLLTDRVMLVPPGRKVRLSSEMIAITVRPGIAFGTGQHPTTCLALQGLESLFSGQIIDYIPEKILDIGTGSGILAVASIKFGGQKALGIDSDPNAVFEARENIALNDLEHCIRIGKTSLEYVQGRYHLILANLRTPTLKDIRTQLSACRAQRSVLIMSGFHPEERKGLIGKYEELGWSPMTGARKGKWEMLMFSYGFEAPPLCK
jgi:ribosomal protein L11 methyltransferase